MLSMRYTIKCIRAFGGRVPRDRKVAAGNLMLWLEMVVSKD